MTAPPPVPDFTGELGARSRCFRDVRETIRPPLSNCRTTFIVAYILTVLRQGTTFSSFVVWIWKDSKRQSPARQRGAQL